MRLTRATTLRFTLDATAAQHQMLLAHAGAFRLAYNHQIGRVKANLEQRAAERSYGIGGVVREVLGPFSHAPFLRQPSEGERRVLPRRHELADLPFPRG